MVKNKIDLFREEKGNKKKLQRAESKQFRGGPKNLDRMLSYSP